MAERWDRDGYTSMSRLVTTTLGSRPSHLRTRCRGQARWRGWWKAHHVEPDTPDASFQGSTKGRDGVDGKDPRNWKSSVAREGPASTKVTYVVITRGSDSLSYASHRALEEADVVYQDEGVGTEEAGTAVERIHLARTSKKKEEERIEEEGTGAWIQDAIRRASQGQRVVRLLDLGGRVEASGVGWRTRWTEEIRVLRRHGIQAVLLPWVDDANLARAAAWIADAQAPHVELDWKGRDRSELWNAEPRLMQQLEMCQASDHVLVHLMGRDGIGFAVDALLQRANKRPEQPALLVTMPTPDRQGTVRWCAAALQHMEEASAPMLPGEEVGDALLLLGDVVQATDGLRAQSSVTPGEPGVSYGESTVIAGSDPRRRPDPAEWDETEPGLVQVEQAMRGEMIQLRDELAYLQRELKQRDDEVEALWDEAAAVLAQEVEKVQEEVVQREQEIVGLEDVVRDQSKSMDGIKSQVRLLLELSRRAMNGKDR